MKLFGSDLPITYATTNGGPMKYRFLSCAGLCVALLATTISPAFADETTTSTTTPSRQTRIEQRQAATEQRQAEACERITTRVATQKATIQERAATTESLYEKQDAKLATLVEKAKANGVDTSDLETYHEIWEEFTDEIKDKRTEIAALIDSAVSLVCDGDREGGRAAFEECRAIVEEIREVKLSRRQYWVNTIVPELKSIRDQLRAL